MLVETLRVEIYLNANFCEIVKYLTFGRDKTESVRSTNVCVVYARSANVTETLIKPHIYSIIHCSFKIPK